MPCKYLKLPVYFLLCIQLLSAHPGIGIVMDSEGSVYYTDLKQVWKLAPDGKKSIAVNNVHSHELFMDAQDNLYGEHLWYEGEVTDTWGHRIWRRSPDGTVTDIIPSRKGFREDYNDFSFVQDGSGNMYWAARGHPTIIKKRGPGGAVTDLTQAEFEDVRWMMATSEGAIYLIDLYDLIHITSQGRIEILAKDLAGNRQSPQLGKDRHAIMGLWRDTRKNLYTAVAADRAVKQISPDGHVRVVARTSPPWTPTGGLVTKQGVLWLLEYSVDNSVRVCRVDPQGRRTIYN